MKTAAIIVVLVLSCSLLMAEDEVMKFALGGMCVSSFTDYWTTSQALDRGAVEANPILRDRLWVKLPLTAGTAWGMWELHKRKPKLALAMTLGITGAYAYLAIRNSRL